MIVIVTILFQLHINLIVRFFSAIFYKEFSLFNDFFSAFYSLIRVAIFQWKLLLSVWFILCSFHGQHFYGRKLIRVEVKESEDEVEEKGKILARAEKRKIEEKFLFFLQVEWFFFRSTFSELKGNFFFIFFPLELVISFHFLILRNMMTLFIHLFNYFFPPFLSLHLTLPSSTSYFRSESFCEKGKIYSFSVKFFFPLVVDKGVFCSTTARRENSPKFPIVCSILSVEKCWICDCNMDKIYRSVENLQLYEFFPFFRYFLLFYD